jgi:hypothetical protein
VTRRDRIVLISVIAVAVVGLFYFFAIKPKRAEVAKLSADVTTQQTELDTARGEVAASQGAQRQFASDYATVARLGKAVPADDDVPSLVYQIQSAAKTTDIDFREVDVAKGSAPASTPPTATQGNAAGNGSSGSGSSGSGSSGSGSGSSGSGSASSSSSNPGSPTATAASAATLPPGASIGSAGFPVMPFSFTFEGSFFRLSDFLRKLDRYVTPRGDNVTVNGRLLTVDGIALSAAESGFPRITASVAATAYLVPGDEGTFGGATPTGPDGTTTGAGTAQPASGGGGTTGTPGSASTTTPSAPAGSQ